MKYHWIKMIGEQKDELEKIRLSVLLNTNCCKCNHPMSEHDDVDLKKCFPEEFKKL